MQNLTGKRALITGGSRGLGKAVALALANEGVDVAITGRNEQSLKQAIAEIESKGVKATFATFDVANKAEVYAGIEQLQKDF